MVLESLLEREAGAVQPGFQCSLLQPRDPEHVLIAQSLDIAQDDEQAVLWIEGGELALDGGLQTVALHRDRPDPDKALDEIRKLMSGNEWDSDTLADVSQILVGTGRSIAEPSDE